MRSSIVAPLPDLLGAAKQYLVLVAGAGRCASGRGLEAWCEDTGVMMELLGELGDILIEDLY